MSFAKEDASEAAVDCFTAELNALYWNILQRVRELGEESAREMLEHAPLLDLEAARAHQAHPLSIARPARASPAAG